MNQCENPDLDLCDLNCGTIDCRSYGCIINSSSFPVVRLDQVTYFRWVIPLGISVSELDILADEISMEKKMDKDEIISHVKQRLDRLNTRVSNTIGIGA